MKSRLVDPQKLHKDLGNFYLSRYLVGELRDYYTIRERETFYGTKPSECKARMACKKNWPICYLALEASKNKNEHQNLLLTCQFILSNFKPAHFSKDKASPLGHKLENAESFTEKINSQKLYEEDLLMERQAHICDCYDKEFERMKSEVRIRVSKQISNFNLEANATQRLEKKGSQEANQVYDNFIKKRRDTQMSSQHEMSDYSPSLGSKPSHELTRYNNTRSLQ